MDNLESIKYDISKSLELMEIHGDLCLGEVDEGILFNHFMRLKDGLQFLGMFLNISKNEDVVRRIGYSASHVKSKLDSLTCLDEDESLVMNLENAYADLREEMKSVIIKPGTNEFYVVFPEITRYDFVPTSRFLCENVMKLLMSDYKSDQISHIKRELDGVVKILMMLIENFSRSPVTVEEVMSAAITSTLDRAACFIYLSFVGKINDEMALSLKNGLSDLIIKEERLIKMYDILHMKKKKSPIYMSLKLLKWNTNCYLRTEKGAALQDHLLSIKFGVQFLFEILELSRNVGFKRRIQELLDIVRRKLQSLSLPRNQEDGNLMVKLDDEFGKLREQMQNAAIKPGSREYDTLFPEILKEGIRFTRTKDFLLEKIRKLVTLSSKADQTTHMMKEVEELREKMTSLKPLFDYMKLEWPTPSALKEVKERTFAALTSFLDKATTLVYFLFVGKLNEDMLVSMRKRVSLLIEETEIKEMSIALGIIFEDELESCIEISLSLLRRQEEYHIGKINEALLKDHIVSMKHGIGFIKWIHKYYIDGAPGQMIALLAEYVKQNLEEIPYEQGGESLNMDVNHTYGDLREKMEIVIFQLALANGFFPRISYVRGNNDFLVEKITSLVTSNCNADKIGPLKKELQNLRKLLIQLKPLDLYVQYEIPLEVYGSNSFNSLLTIYPRATFLICLTFVGKMDSEMADLVKSDLLAIMETDLYKMYSVILNEVYFDSDYLEDELYPLENLILLLKCNVESLNEANSKLYGALIDIRRFLLGLSPNVFLRKLHLLKPSCLEILRHSIPIVCSCYLEHAEVDASVKLDCFLDLIEHIKSEAQEIKLYYFPRVDDLGFLKFFSGYLEDLMKNEESSMKEEIHALHFELHSLLSLAEGTNQERNETRWTDIVTMAYQAEYIVDLYLASTSRDMGLISCLCKVIEKLKKIRADVHGSPSLSDQHVPAVTSNPQVLGTTTHVSDNVAIVGLQEEVRSIQEYLIMGQNNDVTAENKLSSIREKLRKINADMRGSPSLPAQHVPAATSNPQVLGTTTRTSDNDAIVGMHEEVESITEYLSTGENKLDVISIIGMAGVGKTTLASALTLSMGDHFEIVAWCPVSQSYQNRDLLLVILEQVPSFNKNQRSESDDQELADDLCRSLKRRRYLIVLDNIWDTTVWNYLKRYLPDNRNGSRVLITTRNRDVADQIGSKVTELRGLSEEHSWELFQKKIGKESLSEDILEISKGIVDHCKGLPLSIVIIAGVCSDLERTNEKWNQIAESLSSVVLSDPQGNCRAILELSYNHLSNHLRSCFLYLVSFPEGQEIQVNRVILLWIAEGLAQDTKSDSAEEVAKKYVDYLTMKSLVMPTKERSIGGVQTLRLHDLLRDFCLDKAKEQHFLTLLDKINYSRPLRDPRRLIINCSPINDPTFSYHTVRSMICYDLLETSEIDKRIGFCDMVLLKVLEVDKVYSDSLPNISRLVHLRYLALGFMDLKISVLPSSMSKLQNLQILILKFVKGIKVPDLIWDMVKLRHIRISPVALFEVDGNRLENSSVLLENLGSLSRAYISCGDSKWLNKLSGLQRLSCIFVDEEYNDDGEYVEEDDDREEDEEDDDLEEDAEQEEDDDLKANQVRALSFNGNLTALKVECAAGSKQRFRDRCQLPNSLRKLTLSGFFLTSNDISKIGRALLHLEVLKIYSCSVPSGYEWNVDDEEFLELKVLKLRNLSISKWIASEDPFVSLEQLWVEKCDYLDEIPLEFGSLPNLRLLTVRGCAPSVDASARTIEEQQHEEQNTKMRVDIYPKK